MTIVIFQAVSRCHWRRWLPSLLVWLLAPALGGLGGLLWRAAPLPAATEATRAMAVSTTALPLQRSLRESEGSLIVVPSTTGLPDSTVLPSTTMAGEDPEVVPELVPMPLKLDGALALGGPISRESATEPAVPAMVRAERLLEQRSGDPLAALPREWRQSFRRVLALLPKTGGIRPARVVVLPVAQLQREIEVALIHHPSGEVDVFAETLPRQAVAAMEQWLNRQQALPATEVQPLLLRFLPMPASGSAPPAALES